MQLNRIPECFAYPFERTEVYSIQWSKHAICGRVSSMMMQPQAVHGLYESGCHGSIPKSTTSSIECACDWLPSASGSRMRAKCSCQIYRKQLPRVFKYCGCVMCAVYVWAIRNAIHIIQAMNHNFYRITFILLFFVVCCFCNVMNKYNIIWVSSVRMVQQQQRQQALCIFLSWVHESKQKHTTEIRLKYNKIQKRKHI